MNLNNCKLCFNNNNNNKNHDTCKYNYLDIIKDIFKAEINDIQSKLDEKINDCKQLKEQNAKLLVQNEKLMNEIDTLKVNIKRLEDDQANDRKDYELAPETPPTQYTSLNRGMLVDNSNDESYKENSPTKKEIIDNEFSSPDDKSTFLTIPRRKKIPFSITSPNLLTSKPKIQEPKWMSKASIKSSNVGFSFMQPMQKATADQTIESETKLKPCLSKISLVKVKKLKQTRINFNKTSDNLDNTFSISNGLGSNDETYCDDIIMPTPQNISTRSIRSSNSNSKCISPENKIFKFELNPKEESNKKPKLSIEKESNTTPPVSLNDSVEFLPVDDEIIFVSDTTNVNNFESEDSINSCDLLDQYSMEFDQDEIPDVKDNKLAKTHIKPNVQNKYNEYQITSPIRKKSEKAKRPGFDCPDCEKYYQLIGVSMSDTEIQNRMNECSKHRKNQRLHHTPEGFWNPVFTPTQD